MREHEFISPAMWDIRVPMSGTANSNLTFENCSAALGALCRWPCCHTWRWRKQCCSAGLTKKFCTAISVPYIDGQGSWRKASGRTNCVSGPWTHGVTTTHCGAGTPFRLWLCNNVENWPSVVPVRKVQMAGSVRSKRYRWWWRQACSYIQATAAKGIMHFPELCQADVSKRMQDDNDMVTWELDSHVVVMGHTEATNVNRWAMLLVALENWQVVVLQLVWRGWRERSRLRWSFRPNMHHCLTVSCVHKSFLETNKGTRRQENVLEEMQKQMVPHVLQFDRSAHGNNVMGVIGVEQLVVNMGLQCAGGIICRPT